MRRIDLLINEARVETDNKSFTETSGITDEQFLRWVNSAQTRILSLVQQSSPQVFLKETVIDVAANQEEVPVPDDVFMGTRILLAEYKTTSDSQFFRQLKHGSPHERINTLGSVPSFYIRLDNRFLLQPKPQSSGKLRLLRQRILPRLDIRRGTISQVTLDTVNRTITSLTFDNTIPISATAMNAEGYICIVDKNGIIQMKAIPIDNVDEASGVVTVSAGFVYEEGETIAVGDFGVAGVYSTTNSELNNISERYLVEYMIWKLEKRDANDSSQELNQELKDIEQEIQDSYAMGEADIEFPAILDSNYIGNSGWGY